MARVERTCVVCKEQGEKDELVRFVAEPNGDAGVMLDVVGTLPGKGAYCHLTIACLGDESLVERLIGALSRRTMGESGGKQRTRRTQGRGCSATLELLGAVEGSEPASRKQVIGEKLRSLREVQTLIAEREMKKQERLRKRTFRL